MYRALCTFVALTAAFAPAPLARLVSRDVDASAFALAFRAGRADEYKNRQISGAGMSFNGAIAEKLADGSTRTSIVITLGAAGPNGRITPLDTWDAFVDADRARTTVVIALSGPNLPPPPTAAPTLYEFSGVYDGQVRTVARVPAAQRSGNAPSDAGQPVSPDAGPCPGEAPRDQPPDASFYCAPLLTGATATIRR